VLTRGNHTQLAELPPDAQPGAREYTPRVRMGVPPWLPNGLLNPLSIRAFNEMWFRRAPRRRENEIQSITGFFHPLDGVRGWNRIYGSRGFWQYQFVVPCDAESVVRTVLERLSAQRCASFLAVLKRFEHESRGMLGFPIRGWTLALDLPVSGAPLAQLLDELDELVADAGGRVYLTKDSRLRADLLPAMYPQLGRWREIRAALDPRHAFTSDLDRRLGLAGQHS
jgi:decaprenylphospho-beta-D-ribofuranose 2-oxidase